jgi:hypothetical protein
MPAVTQSPSLQLQNTKAAASALQAGQQASRERVERALAKGGATLSASDISREELSCGFYFKSLENACIFGMGVLGVTSKKNIQTPHYYAGGRFYLISI